jgi:hypothetical protein
LQTGIPTPDDVQNGWHSIGSYFYSNGSDAQLPTREPSRFVPHGPASQPTISTPLRK